VVRLSAFLALLARACGQADVVAGLYVSNRQRQEMQAMFGFFVNLVTLRIGFDPAQSFRQWLEITKQRFHESRARAEVPYELLRAELRAQGVAAPEIQVIFKVSDSTRPVNFGGLEVTFKPWHRATMPWGLTLSFDQFQENSQSHLEFDARVYDPEGVRAFLQRYLELLDAVSREPDRQLSDLLGGSPSPSHDSGRT
jgi:non-ribosomal peptide synthetase component F